MSSMLRKAVQTYLKFVSIQHVTQKWWFLRTVFISCLSLGKFLCKHNAYYNTAESDDYINIVYINAEHNLQAYMPFLVHSHLKCILEQNHFSYLESVFNYTIRHNCWVFFSKPMCWEVKQEKRGDFLPVLLLILQHLPAAEAVDAAPHTRFSIQEACKVYGVLLVTLSRHLKKLSTSLRMNIFYILWTMYDVNRIFIHQWGRMKSCIIHIDCCKNAVWTNEERCSWACIQVYSFKQKGILQKMGYRALCYTGIDESLSLSTSFN